MELENLQDLYIHELKVLYSAERQIIQALPTLREVMSDRARRPTRLVSTVEIGGASRKASVTEQESCALRSSNSCGGRARS
jgi:Domain of unknown function (DUF892)